MISPALVTIRLKTMGMMVILCLQVTMQRSCQKVAKWILIVKPCRSMREWLIPGRRQNTSRGCCCGTAAPSCSWPGLTATLCHRCPELQLAWAHGHVMSRLYTPFHTPPYYPPFIYTHLNTHLCPCTSSPHPYPPYSQCVRTSVYPFPIPPLPSPLIYIP